jgi:hypothetical protein
MDKFGDIPAQARELAGRLAEHGREVGDKLQEVPRQCEGRDRQIFKETADGDPGPRSRRRLRPSAPSEIHSQLQPTYLPFVA